MKLHLYHGLSRLRALLLGALALSIAPSSQAVQLTSRGALNNILLSNGRCDTFESIPVVGNQYQFAPSTSVDEFTLIGATSNYVKPMVRYTPGPPLAGSIVILNAAYGGGPTKRMWASNGGGMTITYRVPVRAFGMDFYSFPGFGGNFTAIITMADGAVVNVPFTFAANTGPKFFGYEDSRCIVSVRFADNTGQAAVNFDNHCFGCPPGRGWCEPFPDWAYPFNTSPHQNLTRGWYLAEGLANEAGLIQDNYCSPSRGLFLNTTTDLMRNFRCISNGKYVFSGWWYVPSNSDPVQRSYFMLLNQAHTNPGAFSMQVGANPTNVAFFPAFGGAQTVYSYAGPLTTKTNQWVNVCAFIDLTNDRFQVYYDGQFLVDAQWRSSDLNSLLQIYAINVYGGDLGGTSWVDDLAIVRDCPKTYQIGRPDNFNPGWVEATPKSPQLLPWLAAPPLGFDQIPNDQSFGASFMGLPTGPCKNFKGKFVSRMRPRNINGTNANNDRLWLGLNNSNAWAFNDTLANLAPPPPWTTVGTRNVSVNLNNNVLSTINQVGRLDFMTRWFTGADYARLQLWNCCPCWRGYWWDTIGPVELDFSTAGNLRPNFQPGAGSVVCDLGTSSGGELTFAASPSFDDLDVGLSLTKIGHVNGVEGQSIGRLNIAGGETAATLSVDYSSINPSFVRLKLYNQAGAMLLDQARPQNSLAFFTQPASLQLISTVAKCVAPSACCIITVAPTTLLVGGTTVPNVARIEVVAINPTASIGNISDLQLYGQGNPTVELSNVRGLLPGGLAISALGGAVLSSVDGGIIVNSLVEPEDDGIRIDLPNSNGFRTAFAVDWVPFDQACPVEITSFANRNGVPNSEVGSVFMNERAGGFDVLADYSTVSSPTMRVVVFREGAVVTDQTGLPLNAVRLAELPIDCEGRSGFLNSPSGLRLGMGSIQPITVMGTNYQGDCVALLAVPNVPTTVTQFSGVEITSATQNEMFIGGPMALRSLAGTITLEDYEPNEAGNQVLLEFCYPGSEEILDTEYVTLGTNGTFSTVTGLYGTVECFAKSSHWLRKRVVFQVGDSGASGVSITLVNGDCDRDNEVGIGDYAQLAASYGKCVGDLGFLADADLNGDGCVDIADYAILSANYGEVGD